MFQEISVKVTPKAHSNQIIGWKAGLLCIRIAAAPEKGEANEELERFMAKVLAVSKSSVQVAKGHGSRLKLLKIHGLTPEKLEKAIQDHATS